MRKILLLFFLLPVSFKMEAQTTEYSPAGAYHLKGVMETACGFKLDKDSSFQFFFSQGALDRYGEGKWSVINNAVVLNSRKKPANDFRMLQSVKHNNDSITIKILEENTFALSHVYCTITGGGKKQEAMTNEDGLAAFSLQELDSIELLFEFCPEKKSIFVIKEKQHNYFEFAFETWMLEVFFADFYLTVDKDGLTGINPVIKGNSYKYMAAEK